MRDYKSPQVEVNQWPKSHLLRFVTSDDTGLGPKAGAGTRQVVQEQKNPFIGWTAVETEGAPKWREKKQQS